MNDQHLWLAALVTFGAGDVITTGYGLQLQGVEEEQPASEAVLDATGTEGMVAVKAAVFLAAYLAYHNVPSEYRAGIPLGLALLGVLVVTNNSAVIAQVEATP